MNPKEVARLNELRALRTSYPELMRVLQLKKDVTLSRLIGCYRIGEDFDHLVAELSAYSELISAFEGREKELIRLEEKFHKET